MLNRHSSEMGTNLNIEVGESAGLGSVSAALTLSRKRFVEFQTKTVTTPSSVWVKVC